MSEAKTISGQIEAIKSALASLPFIERAGAREQLAELESKRSEALQRESIERAAKAERERVATLQRLEAERVANAERSHLANTHRNELEAEYWNASHRFQWRDAESARSMSALLSRLAEVWQASATLSAEEKAIAAQLEALEVKA